MFSEDLQNGRDYEIEFCKIYNNKNSKVMVHNDLKHAVDFNVYYKNELVQTTELKTDFHLSENVFVETISNTNKNSVGGPYQAKENYNATYYVCWFPMDKTDNTFIFKNDELVKWLDDNKHNYPSSFIKNNGYYTKGRIIPKSVLRELPFTVVQTFLSSINNY